MLNNCQDCAGSHTEKLNIVFGSGMLIVLAGCMDHVTLLIKQLDTLPDTSKPLLFLLPKCNTLGGPHSAPQKSEHPWLHQV